MKTNILFSTFVLLFSLNALSAQISNGKKMPVYPKDGRKPTTPLNSGVQSQNPNEISQRNTLGLVPFSLQVRIKLPFFSQIVPWVINPKDIKVKVFEITKSNRDPNAFFETCQYTEITNFEIAEIDLIKPKTESEPWGVVYFIKGLNTNSEYSTHVTIDALKPANTNQRIDASGMLLPPSFICGSRGKVGGNPVEVAFKVVSK
ncbi:MAG: hypothetical protein JNL70_04055 [Saprospiraceae bacterium]|nr:hypothetical protein [Saprospiraceae bacterium]